MLNETGFEVIDRAGKDGGIDLRFISGEESAQFKLDCLSGICQVKGRMKFVSGSKSLWQQYSFSLDSAKSITVAPVGANEEIAKIPSYISPTQVTFIRASKFPNTLPVESVTIMLVTGVFETSSSRVDKTMSKTLTIMKAFVVFRSNELISCPPSLSSYAIKEVVMDKITLFRGTIALPKPYSYNLDVRIYNDKFQQQSTPPPHSQTSNLKSATRFSPLPGQRSFGSSSNSPLDRESNQQYRAIEIFIFFMSVLSWLIVRSWYLTAENYNRFTLYTIAFLLLAAAGIFSFRGYALSFLRRWSRVPECNGRSFFVNGWNAWSFAGCVLQGTPPPVYSMPSYFVKAFHDGGVGSAVHINLGHGDAPSPDQLFPTAAATGHNSRGGSGAGAGSDGSEKEQYGEIQHVARSPVGPMPMQRSVGSTTTTAAAGSSMEHAGYGESTPDVLVAAAKDAKEVHSGRAVLDDIHSVGESSGDKDHPPGETRKIRSVASFVHSLYSWHQAFWRRLSKASKGAEEGVGAGCACGITNSSSLVCMDGGSIGGLCRVCGAVVGRERGGCFGADSEVIEAAKDFVASDMFSIVADTKTKTGIVLGFLSQRKQYGCIAVNKTYDRVSVHLSGDGVLVPSAGTISTDWLAIYTVTHLQEPFAAYMAMSSIENEVYKKIGGHRCKDTTRAALPRTDSFRLSFPDSPDPEAVMPYNPDSANDDGIASSNGVYGGSCEGKNSSGCGGGTANGKVPTGWCSWYHFYDKISEGVLLNNATLMGGTGSGYAKDADIRAVRKQGFGLFQVDDGYQRAWGDWTAVDPQKFPSGSLSNVVQQAKASDLRPGLWLAPFSCDKHATIAKLHPEWILKKHGSATSASNSANCGKFFYGLDTTHPEVQEHLRHTLHVVTSVWGFSYLKLDFLYAAALADSMDSRYNRQQTHAQVLREAMALVAEAAAEKEVYVLGCGAPLGSTIGLVHANRISAGEGALSRVMYSAITIPYFIVKNFCSHLIPI
jgi:hypothetical protein